MKRTNTHRIRCGKVETWNTDQYLFGKPTCQYCHSLLPTINWPPFLTPQQKKWINSSAYWSHNAIQHHTYQTHHQTWWILSSSSSNTSTMPSSPSSNPQSLVKLVNSLAPLPTFSVPNDPLSCSVLNAAKLLQCFCVCACACVCFFCVGMQGQGQGEADDGTPKFKIMTLGDSGMLVLKENGERNAN